MHVTELEIDNFKSFSGVTRIPFYEGFTVISGPNGSGKSNIIDSLLFVLSLSSSSGLRAEKLTDLINVDSGKHHSQVKVTFSDGTTIRRRIKRAAHGYYSYYYLNERVSTQTEILEFLSRHGIKPEGYNVVMQGDITRIMEMSDLERRRIIDEIAGVAEFDQKRDQALQELEIVRERIEREEIVLRELESRLKELEKERERAIAYRELQKEIEGLEAAKIVARIRSLEREHATLIGVAGEKRSQLERLLAERMRQEKALEDAKALFSGLEETIARKSGPEYMGLVSALEERRGSIRVAEQTIARLRQEKEKDGEALNRIFMDSKRADARIKELTDRLKEMNIDRANLAMDLASMKASLEESEREFEEMGREAEEAKKRLLHLMQEMEAAKEARSQLVRERDALIEKSRIRTSEIERIQGLLSQSEGDAKEREKKGQGLKGLLVECERKKAELEARLANTEQRLFAARSGLDETRVKARSLEQELARLEAEQRTREDSGNRALEAVLGLEGVHGTIRKLGRAKREFALALEVAAGSRMNYVVVEDDRIAEDAIRYLKETGLGRVTFLPLNRMNPPSLPRVRENGVLGYAVEFLEFDRRYEPAFRVVFGQTLVVDTLTHARALLGRHRMVTLEGELLERSGAMTGGHVKKKGGFALSLDEDIARIQKELAELKVEGEELEGAVRSLTAEAERLREERAKLSEEIVRIRTTVEEHEKRAQEYAAERESLERTLAMHRGEMESGASAMNELEGRIGEINARIAKLSSDMEQLQGDLNRTKIPALAARMEKERQEVFELDRRIRSKEGEISDIQRERSYFLKRKEELEAERQRIAEKHSGIEGEIKELSTQIERETVTLEELQNKLKSFSTELEELRARREEHLASIGQAEKALKDLEYSVERLTLEIRALDERANSMRMELESLRAQTKEVQEVELSVEEIEGRLREATIRLREMGAVNMLAIEEYEQVMRRVEERRSRKDTLSSERTSLIERIDRYEQMKYDAFMKAFREIDSNFRRIFARLMKGTGHLVLGNEENPFEGGLTFAVKPQEKNVHILTSLSGGEKSIVTLAFIFAIQQYMPAPFYAMDEIDMFLDGSNVELVADMIRDLSANNQFILVSLRKPMIERADRILGVTRRQDKSTLVTGVKANG